MCIYGARARNLIPLADFRADVLDDGAAGGDLVASAFRLLLGRPFARDEHTILELEAFLLLVDRIGTLGRADVLDNVTIECCSRAAILG